MPPHVLREAIEGGKGRAGAQPDPYLGPRTSSGDMMMDGVPGVRAGNGCGRSFFPVSSQAAGTGREIAGAGRGHQLMYGQGTRTTHLGGHPLVFGHRHGQGGIAEFTQRVIAAAQDFSVRPPASGFCRCRGARPTGGSRRNPGNRGGPRT
jgi:hypothetical protein